MLFRFTIACAYFLSILNLGGTLGIDRFNPIEKALFLLAALLFALGRKPDWKILTLMGIEILMVIFLGSQTDFAAFSWTILFGALNQILIPFLMLAGNPTKKDIIFFLKIVAYLALTSSAIGLLYGAIGIYNPNPLEFNTGSQRFAGTLNPAFLSAYATAGALAAFKLGEILHKRYFLLCVANFVILLATKGRTMTALTFVIIGLSLLTSRRIAGATKLKAILLTTVGAVLTLPLILYLYSDRLEKSGDSNRELMWSWLREMADRYHVFGIGFGQQYWSTPREIYIYFSKAAHNDYLRLHVELGTFGVFAFYGVLTFAIYCFWRRNRASGDITIWTTYLALMTDSLVDNALASPSTFTLITVGAMASSAVATWRGPKLYVRRPYESLSHRRFVRRNSPDPNPTIDAISPSADLKA